MMKLATTLLIALFSAFSLCAQDAPKDLKTAKKELAKNLKEAKVLSTDAAKPDFAAARKQIAAALANPLYKENEADVLHEAGNVEYHCFNVERNKPAKGGKMDNSVLYATSEQAFRYYLDAYNKYLGSGTGAKDKNCQAIQKKAWILFTSTAGFRVNAASAVDKKDWATSHKCFSLLIEAVESPLVKTLIDENIKAKAEYNVLINDSIINQAKYFRAMSSLYLNDTINAIKELEEIKYNKYEQQNVLQELCRLYQASGNDFLFRFTLFEGVRLVPSDAWFAQNLTNIYLADKDYQGASVIMDDLLKVAPDNATVLALKGTLVELLGDPDAGLEYMEKAYAIDSTNVTVLSDLGRVWYNKATMIETQYFDKREYDKADSESLPLYIKSADYYMKAFEFDKEHTDNTIANGIRNVRYKQFTKADCANPQELIDDYNKVSRAYKLPEFRR